MDIEKVRKWIDALRSGKYEQGRNRLRWGNQFCCLGVACDVSGEGEWTEAGTFTSMRGGGLTTIPPLIAKDFGLDGQVQQLLMYKNDVHGHSFAQIADFIEEHILGSASQV